MGSDQKKVILTIVGAVLLCAPALAVGIFVENPNALLNNTCRALLGLGVALLASYLPGHLDTKFRTKFKAVDAKIKATGAIAVFVIVYLLSAGK